MSERSDAAKEVLQKLTPQRKKFVEAFCVSFNATKAALAAKYSPKTARTQGSALWTIIDIKLAIKAVLNTAGMDSEEIAAHWDRIARVDLPDFYTKFEYEEKIKASISSYLDCLEFVNKRLSDAEAAAFYSKLEGNKSYESNVLARYRFLGNLNDDINTHTLSAQRYIYQ